MGQVNDTRTAPLDARELYRFFRVDDEEILALRGVSIRVDAGEIVSVVGPSGSGKSTLLACLAGLDEPAAGTVWVDGTRLTSRSEATRAAMRAEQIGVLFQDGNLIGHLTIEETSDWPRSWDRSDATPLLMCWTRSAWLSARGPIPLSCPAASPLGPDWQSRWPTSPRSCWPTNRAGELDGETEQRVLTLFRDRADLGCAVLLVTHSPDVTAVADRVVSLSDGRVAS